MTMVRRSEANNGGHRPSSRPWPSQIEKKSNSQDPDPMQSPTSNKPRKKHHTTQDKSKIPTSLVQRHIIALLLLLIYQILLANMMDNEIMVEAPTTKQKRVESVMKKSTKTPTLKMMKVTLADLPVDEAIIPTKANHQILEDLMKDLMLDEEEHKWLKTPYKTYFGDNKGDPYAFYDDLGKLIVMIGKWKCGKSTLPQDFLAKVQDSDLHSPAITTTQWSKLTRLLFMNNDTLTTALSSEERCSFWIIML
jgi:hypothetical protein